MPSFSGFMVTALSDLFTNSGGRSFGCIGGYSTGTSRRPESLSIRFTKRLHSLYTHWLCRYSLSAQTTSITRAEYSAL